jgi:hypothetical protein
MIWLWVILAVMTVSAVVIVARWWNTMTAYMEGKREAALRRWADKRGWTFSRGAISTFAKRFPKFRQLQQGSNAYADNVVRGRFDGQEVWAFDYHYTSGSGSSETSHSFSAAVVYPALRMLPLHVHPNGPWDKFGELIGERGIEFELAEFNRVFHVRASNERWAFDVLPQATLEFLLDSPSFVLEFQDIYVAAWRNQEMSAADFDDALYVIFGVLERIPADIRKALKRR